MKKVFYIVLFDEKIQTHQNIKDITVWFVVGIVWIQSDRFDTEDEFRIHQLVKVDTGIVRGQKHFRIESSTVSSELGST